MRAIDHIQSRVTDQSVLCDVLRSAESGSYSDQRETVDTAHVAVFAGQSAAEMVPAGMDATTSFTGLVVPETDHNDELVHHTQVGDVLRPTTNTAKRYTVETRSGAPNDLDPHLWVLGLDRAND